MRALLSTIGSRGDVQPLVALATQLRAHGHEVRICAPPDFREWLDELAIPFTALGPEVRSTAKSSTRPTAAEIRGMMEATVATQFATIPAAAEGCDVIVAGNALNIAARSVAEKMGIRYVFAAYCPITLPSVHHAPPAVLAWKPQDATADNRTLWAEDAQRWNERWGSALNSHRAAAGLDPVTDVRSHILSDAPWLAADATLAPWPEPLASDVVQTGAWILPDQHPLSPETLAFLEAGEPPVYFGFGSVRTPLGLSDTIVETARRLGRRAIVSRGWADLAPWDNEADRLSVGEVNQQLLFKRVAVVVHHGGAGTTTAAARAGAPQVVIPQHYDQHYWARQVDQLGIGAAHAPGAPTTDSLTGALERVLQPGVADRARSIANLVRTNGANLAAERLVAFVS